MKTHTEITKYTDSKSWSIKNVINKKVVGYMTWRKIFVHTVIVHDSSKKFTDVDFF